jgi:small nuclear ribonucleoprotein (snRNP)-like protein
MEKVIDKFVGAEVVVTLNAGNALTGTLKGADTFGIFVLAEAETNDEVKEKIACYVPHKDYSMIHAREDENKGKTFDTRFGVKG